MTRGGYMDALGALQVHALDMLGGGDSREWDNHNTYAPGDVVYYGQRYWRAVRQIDPPLLPVFQSGEVPGDSDAWRETAAPVVGHGHGHGGGGHGHGGGHGGFRGGGGWGWPYYDDDGVDVILVDEDDDDGTVQVVRRPRIVTVLGMFDMNNVQKNLSALTPVTVEIARVLVKTGLSTIAQAIAGAKVPQDAAIPSFVKDWTSTELPGGTERKSVQAHLQWHADKLAPMVGDRYAVYESFDDLKKWVVAAFVDGNSVEEGAAYLDAAWRAMWDEIQAKLAAMPKAVFAAAVEAAAKVGAAVVPWWVWVLGGIGVLGVGVLTYKIVTGPVGGSVVHHYLGGR